MARAVPLFKPAAPRTLTVAASPIWTGTGYSIYFIANKQSTQNAVSIWTTAPNNSTKEMLDTATNTLSANGGNFVGLDADPKIASAIAQTIAGLTIGAQYQLKYSWAASQLQSATGITLNDYVHVTFGSAAADSVNKVASNPSAGFSGWFNETVTFTATTTSQTLTFLSKSDSTSLPPFILLDGITLYHVVPEPGTIGLVGAGLGLVALAGARRRKSQG